MGKKLMDLLVGVTKDVATTKDEEKSAPEYTEEAQAVLDAISGDNAAELGEALALFIRSVAHDLEDEDE